MTSGLPTNRSLVRQWSQEMALGRSNSGLPAGARFPKLMGESYNSLSLYIKQEHAS